MPPGALAAVAVLAASLPAAVTAAAAESGPPGPRIRVLIVDGYGNHDWRRTTALLREILDPTGLFDVAVSTAPAADATALAAWRPPFGDRDVIIQTCNDLGGGPSWPPAAREAFERFVLDGGGAFIFHSANNAFPGWKGYGRTIGLGWRGKEAGPAIAIDPDGKVRRIPAGEGEATSHGPRTDRVVHRLGDHPIHGGLPRRWKTPSLEVYRYPRGPAEGLTVLSWAEDPEDGSRWPVEWAVEHGKGRAYGSTFGHVWPGEEDPVGMRCAGFRTILVRALLWLARRPVALPVPPDFPGEDRVVLRPPGQPPARRG